MVKCNHLRPIYLSNKGRYRPQWMSVLVENSTEMEQYDWLRNGFLSGWGLHYGRCFSAMENFKPGWRKWHGWPTCQHFFLLGSSLDIKFLGQPKILRQKNWPLENSNSRFSLVYFIIIIESIIPIVVSNNFVLDWTSWPIGALLHHKVCGCHLIHFSCSPTSTDYIHTTKPRVALTNLWWNIYNIRLQSKPPLL